MAKRAADRLQALQREADRLASEERTVLTDLKKLEIDRQLKAEELKQLTADEAKVNQDLDAISLRSAALEKSEQDARPELRARVVEIYKLGKARYLRLLLSAPDLKRFTDATRTVATLAKLDRERVASHEKTLAELTSTRKTLEERQRQVTELRANAEKAEAALQRAAVARNNLVRDIDKKRDLNAQMSGELQSAQQKLQAALRDVNADPGTRNAEPALPFKPFKGDLDWPIAGTVRGKFGQGTRANGIEIDSDEGADARAVHDGTVAFAGTFTGFGNLVILDHGSQTFSLYGDLLDITVKKGARIEKGQPVGSAGATAAGNPGIYFELRVDGKPVDPLQWLRRR
ncbi:MAG TPA: peptidoglycan DD-metalloendopeptidase family protein [Vicinamibacterales bacterium]|nr:peptidoglycan DD-metalloendopeptidase family protein [Vicinamibacterales bacterium]